MSASSAFGTKKPLPGTKFRTGDLGLIVHKVYQDVEAGFEYAEEHGGGGVPTSRTLTGSGAIKIGGDNSAHDLSANRTITIADATNAVPGAATAAQITALEAIVKLIVGLQAPLTGTTGVVDATHPVTVCDPSGDASYTGPAAGVAGQLKVVCNKSSSHAVTLTDLGSVVLAATPLGAAVVLVYDGSAWLAVSAFNAAP